jgi:phosphoglycerol transferase MdoB-like AlkP superfamily enzyme
MSTQRKSKHKHFKTSFYFQVLLIYMNLVLHIFADHSGVFSLICDLLFSIPIGMFLGIATSAASKRLNHLLTQLLTALLAVYFLIRICRAMKFGGFLPILGVIVCIILLVLPCLFIVQYGRRYLSFRRYHRETLLTTLVAALVMLVIIGIISFAGSHIGNSKSDQGKTEKKDTSVQSSVTQTKATGPNVMDIDFDAILSATSGLDDSEDISTIVDSLSNAQSTNKNEYTGMFQGYNVIFVTAENLSKYAISQELTPTLYSMMNSGFVFNNYYSQNFVSSATGNEYALTNSMIPGSAVKEALGEVSELDRNMYFSLEDQLQRLGYKVNTYSDVQYDDFVFDSSSASSMIAQTTADYAGTSTFYTEYTVNAGLSSYDYDEDNIFAEKLNDLDYSDSAKAYLAYQMALDQEMEELISALQTAGVADKTLIVIAPNPSSTSTQSILEEISGEDLSSTLNLRSNALIVYSVSMTSSVTVDKYCSTLDVLPTISNLLGLDYDSRLMMGTDALSDSSQFVPFLESSGYSFINDSFQYDVESGESVSLSGSGTLNDMDIESMTTTIENMCNISNLIFRTDFFKYIDPSTDLTSLSASSSNDSTTSDATGTSTDETSTDETSPTGSSTSESSSGGSGNTLTYDNTSGTDTTTGTGTADTTTGN